MREILSDLVAEQQFLDQSLQRIPIKLWDKVTPAKPWTVRDTIAHLADFAELAADALTGGNRVKEYQNASDLDALRQRAIEKGRSMRPQDVIEWWRAGRAKVVEAVQQVATGEMLVSDALLEGKACGEPAIPLHRVNTEATHRPLDRYLLG